LLVIKFINLLTRDAFPVGNLYRGLSFALASLAMVFDINLALRSRRL
jgi:hypothetical protein